jgi:hypothetical protein
MIAKRIRCECGRVYEPAKSPACPSCGAETKVATVVEPKATESAGKEASPIHVRDIASAPAAFGPRTLIIAGALLTGVILLFLLITRNPKQESVSAAKMQPAQTAQSATPATPSTAGAMPVIVPPYGGNQSVILPQSFDLTAAIATAAPGATIKVPVGFYPGGIVLNSPVRIIGTPGTVIQSDGRECLSVRATGVFVQNVQFICNGIGELPAISIAEGAELELDGCRIQSMTTLGVAMNPNSGLKALGTTFTASNGVALRVGQGHVNLTQSTIADSKVGLSAANGGKAELKSCALERNGANDPQGGILVATGQGTNIIANDCHFTSNSGGISVLDNATFSASSSSFKSNLESANAGNSIGLIATRGGSHATIAGCLFEGNGQGLAVSDRGVLEVDQSTFSRNGSQTRQLVLPAMPISITGQGSTAAVRNSKILDSVQFGIAMLDRASVTLDDVEVARARVFGLAVGDTSSPPGRAEIKHSRFHDNGTGIGVYAGSTVNIEDSEIRENNDGIIAGDQGTQLEMHKTHVVGNRERGIAVFSEAQGTVTGSEFRGNARGAVSGLPKKSSGRARLTLQDCVVGGNRVFGVGVFAQNELILTRVNFEGGDKQDIYKERNAIVQTEATPAPEGSPSPAASPEASASPGEQKPQASPTPASKRRPRPTPRPRRLEDDATRILRHFFPR